MALKVMQCIHAFVEAVIAALIGMRLWLPLILSLILTLVLVIRVWDRIGLWLKRLRCLRWLAKQWRSTGARGRAEFYVMAAERHVVASGWPIAVILERSRGQWQQWQLIPTR